MDVHPKNWGVHQWTNGIHIFGALNDLNLTEPTGRPWLTLSIIDYPWYDWQISFFKHPFARQIQSRSSRWLRLDERQARSLLTRSIFHYKYLTLQYSISLNRLVYGLWRSSSKRSQVQVATRLLHCQWFNPSRRSRWFTSSSNHLFRGGLGIGRTGSKMYYRLFLGLVRFQFKEDVLPET